MARLYGSFANNALNAAPFFFNQQYQLATQGVGAFPSRWPIPLFIAGPPAAP